MPHNALFRRKVDKTPFKGINPYLFVFLAQIKNYLLWRQKTKGGKMKIGGLSERNLNPLREMNEGEAIKGEFSGLREKTAQSGKSYTYVVFVGGNIRTGQAEWLIFPRVLRSPTEINPEQETGLFTLTRHGGLLDVERMA